MSLADDVLAALPEFRRTAEALMLDVGSAQRPTGRGYDPTLQAEVDTFDPDFGFTSRCKIQSRNTVALEAEVGGRTAVTVRYELHLPIGTDPLEVGDVWTVTTPHPLSTVPTGTAYRVSGPAEGTQKTARRYEVDRQAT